MAKPDQLSELQLAFLRALWDLGEGGVNDVKHALQGLGRALAPTTVATVLGRLEKRGYVRHRREGRQYIYSATVGEHDLQRSMLRRLTETLFSGDVTAVFSHLLHAREVGPGDLAQVKALIEARERAQLANGEEESKS
ncbi:MAG: BlaI/MecI/CopY family transcriptional regulator [Nannocystaceae bacterium]